MSVQACRGSECFRVSAGAYEADRERSHGVVSFTSGREAAMINTHLLKGRRGSLIAPGQLKSLGTDAFIAFGSEPNRKVR